MLQVFIGIDMVRSGWLLRFLRLLLTCGFGRNLILREQIAAERQRRQQAEEGDSWPPQTRTPNWKMQRHQPSALQVHRGDRPVTAEQSDAEFCRVQ